LGEIDAGDDRPEHPSGGPIEMPRETRHPRRGQAKMSRIKALGIERFGDVRHVPLRDGEALSIAIGSELP